MNPLSSLVDDITTRKQFLLNIKGDAPDKRNKAWKLYDIPAKQLIELTYGHVLTGIERKSALTQVVSSMGSCINRRLRLREDEITEMHLGWFVLISYFETGILDTYARHKKVNNRRSKFPVYQLKVKNIEAIKALINLVDDTSVDLFPLKEPPQEWSDEFLHKELGFPLIKNAHEKAIQLAKDRDLSYLKYSLNKLQNTGWRINKPVFDVFKQCKTSSNSPFKFTKEVDPEKKASLLIELEGITALAERNIDNAFYHLYNCDFRGRIYPNTAFLHEQSSDNAKGILMLDQPVPLGESGYYWLSVHTANMWGNDKVSLDDRAQWVKDNMDNLLSYAEAPMLNTGWMKADKPFCFLACCYEFSMLSNWHGDGYATEDFPSCLPIYIDGSNNGVQHLVAMSKDEEIAPLVNLTPSDIPGDVYAFIAEKTWDNVSKDKSSLHDKIKDKFSEIHPTLVKLRQEVSKQIVGSERYNLAMKKLKEFSNSCYDTKKQLGPVFWDAITDKKIRRKTVKRPVMTLGYGGTKFGMVDMVHDDTRDLSEYLRDKDKAWSAYLGHLIFNTCYKELKGPAKMLTMFERLAVQENEKDKPISFSQIITNFPFVHSYKEPQTKEVELFYAGTSFRLSVQVWKKATLKKSKQKTGAAPNIVHSVDATHLTMVIHDADYPVTVVHDSFGCHAGNMERMFYHVREKFVELYELNPLEHIMSQMDALELIPQKGNLDVRQVLESDFAFA